MAAFNFFRKSRTNLVELPKPDDSISFFDAIKNESENYWKNTTPNKSIYGFQTQQGSMWRSGLSDSEINSFEMELGFSFPASLRNFYRAMNGLTKPGINFYGGKAAPNFRPVFYSFKGCGQWQY